MERRILGKIREEVQQTRTGQTEKLKDVVGAKRQSEQGKNKDGRNNRRRKEICGKPGK